MRTSQIGIGTTVTSDKRIVKDDLEALLHRAVIEAQFEVKLPLSGMSQRTVCSNANTLRGLFRKFEAWRDSIQVTTLLKDNLLSELSEGLKSALGNHITNDRVAAGLPSYLLGVWTNPFTVKDLALSSVRAAVFIGPERVSRLCRDWERGKPIRYQSHVVLSGVSADESLRLDLGKRGTALFQKLPNSTDEVRHHLPRIDQHSLRVSDYLGAVKVTVNHGARSALFRDSEPDPWGWDVVSSPYTSVLSLSDALSIACNNYVTWTLAWSESKDWSAFGQGERLVMYKRNNSAPENVVPLAPEISRLLSDTLSKKLHVRDGGPQFLDLAIQRWVRSKRHVGMADQLVDLRIALEALYLDNDVHGELSFRLATHVAWHLGEDADERLKYQTIIRKVYGLASRVKHGQKVKFTSTEKELLATAQGLCRRGILKVLDWGKRPDWKKLILGAEM